jgi:hypothetical protein
MVIMPCFMSLDPAVNLIDLLFKISMIGILTGHDILNLVSDNRQGRFNLCPSDSDPHNQAQSGGKDHEQEPQSAYEKLESFTASHSAHLRKRRSR